MEHLGGKKTCKYYKTCDNTENCSRCKGYKNASKNKKKLQQID